MFFKKKAREPDKDLTSVSCSPYIDLYPADYVFPEQMVKDIQDEALKILEEAYENNLIDEFSIELMKEENKWFLDQMIHQMFRKPLNNLKKQRVVKDRQVIASIKTLQKGALKKEQSALVYAKEELEQCEFILGTGKHSKVHVYNKMIGGKDYE